MRDRGGSGLAEKCCDMIETDDPVNGTAAGCRLVDHHPQRIQVGTVVQPAPSRLLRAHVMRRAPDDARFVSLLGDHREPEVRQLGHVAGGQQHVGRLDVAVDHPLVMRVIERLGHLGQDLAAVRPATDAATVLSNWCR